MSQHKKDLEAGTIRKPDKDPEWGTKTEHYNAKGELKPKPKPKATEKKKKKKSGLIDRFKQYGSGQR